MVMDLCNQHAFLRWICGRNCLEEEELTRRVFKETRFVFLFPHFPDVQTTRGFCSWSRYDEKVEYTINSKSKYLFIVQANLQQCQKCLEYGHYSYECKASERPYKARPTRTQILKNPKLLPKLSIDEEPNSLLEKYSLNSDNADFRTGIADKLLEEKEKEREKRARSKSVSTYSSRSASVSTYSSDSEEEEGGDRKRVRRDSRSRSPSSHSSSYASERSRSRSASPAVQVRGRSRQRQSRSVSSRAESVESRHGRYRSEERVRRSPSPEDSPKRRSPSPVPRQRSPSPVRRPAQSRWDKRGPSPPRERSLSPYSKRKLLARQQ